MPNVPENKSYCEQHEILIDRGTPCLYCVLESMSDASVLTIQQIARGPYESNHG